MVIGADFCAPMLQYGKKKTARSSGGHIVLMMADTLHLPYRSHRFDCVTVGFGIRNVSDIHAAFAEMARVTKPGGRVVCLEFNQPRSPFLRVLVQFYELKVLPWIGGLLSRREAYTYLPQSIQTFPSREELKAVMESVGLGNVRVVDLNFGSVCIHIGTKS
jgi:demethylmenaquinone methyltransferase/2-methoxy-6-polyprenyl-1,4-benzoquinol methylase